MPSKLTRSSSSTSAQPLRSLRQKPSTPSLSKAEQVLSPTLPYFDRYPDRDNTSGRRKNVAQSSPRPETDPLYLFPSVEDAAPQQDVVVLRPRPRSRTSPYPQDPRHSPTSTASPPPRFSASSSLTQTTVDTGAMTPPRTPPTFRSDSFSSHVSVIAPVSGVETMDALVDGMNADFGNSDPYSSMLKSRMDKRPMRHHPLYHPPLPEPPPGVKLGRATTSSRRSRNSNSSHTKTRSKTAPELDESEADVEDLAPTTPRAPTAPPVSRIPVLVSFPRRDQPSSSHSKTASVSSKTRMRAPTPTPAATPLRPQKSASRLHSGGSGGVAVARPRSGTVSNASPPHTPSPASTAPHRSSHARPMESTSSIPPPPRPGVLTVPRPPHEAKRKPPSMQDIAPNLVTVSSTSSSDAEHRLSSSPSSPSLSQYVSATSSPRYSSGQDAASLVTMSSPASSHPLQDHCPPIPKPSMLVPSITDIIRAHAPEVAASREREKARGRASNHGVTSRSSSRSGYGAVIERSGTHASSRNEDESSHGHGRSMDVDRRGSLPFQQRGHKPLLSHRRDIEEDQYSSRSSMDSIAQEVERSLTISPPRPKDVDHHPWTPPHSARSVGPPGMHSRVAHLQTSPVSFLPDAPGRRPSGSSFGSRAQPAVTLPPGHSPRLANPTKEKDKDNALALASYLRSPRLTRLLKLRRTPHSTGVTGSPTLQVSLSDVGREDGRPVVVFLGLGCVRYLTALYDEMASALNLRLICVDRWGLGRTSEPIAGSTQGVLEWASVMEEVLDILGIRRVSVMAHSAGAPYAMAFAQRLGSRIEGDVCLLAPWVGGAEGAGYKWLKYVPNSLLKTAQAAEWKVQAWMLGKPPTITYDGIGYDSRTPPASKDLQPPGRPSFSGSSFFSEYDDLSDFQGRFGSGSTLCVADPKVPPRPGPVNKRKISKGFLTNLWKPGSSGPNSPGSPTSSPPAVGSAYAPRLKGLKSMGSLKTSYKAQRLRTNSTATSILPKSPILPQVPSVGVGLGLDWNDIRATGGATSAPGATSVAADAFSEVAFLRGRRSVSDNSSHSPRRPPSPSMSFASTQTPLGAKGGTETSFASALLAASHAESSRGITADLLCILNNDQKPWGFSYSSFPHPVKVWYGDRDEKISEAGVRWMEKVMRRCQVTIVKGAGHSLMVNSSVVVEVLECLAACWDG